MHHVSHEPSLAGGPSDRLSQREVFWRTTLTDRNLSSSLAGGLVNNLNDGMAWGLFPLWFAALGMSLDRSACWPRSIPAIWGIAHSATGALSDQVGRKWLIAGGMWVQAAGIVAMLMSDGLPDRSVGAVLLGLGTAMVYPTLLAAISDVAHPSWRASAVGVYRLWRDLGYAIGALLCGACRRPFGLPAAMAAVAALTFVSGVVVALRMRETLA